MNDALRIKPGWTDGGGRSKTAADRTDEFCILNIPLIDRQHRNLLRMTNNLHYACLENTEVSRIRLVEAFHSVGEYLSYHAKTEEKLMLLVEFPEFSDHENQHQNIITEVLDQLAQVNNNKEFVPDRFILFLKDWIITHISVYDRTFTEYLLDMKQLGKMKMILLGNGNCH